MAKIEQVVLNSIPSPWFPACSVKAHTFLRKYEMRLPSPETNVVFEENFALSVVVGKT